MSCSNCPCEECQEDREQEFYDEEEAPESSPVCQEISQPAPTHNFKTVRVTEFGPRKSPPLTGKIGELIEESFRSVMNDIVGNNAVNMQSLVQIILGRVAGIPANEWNLRYQQVTDLLREKAQDPKSGYGIFRGRGGGFMRSPVAKVSTNTSAAAINNHTCAACGNTKCSKTERSCWKCGTPIQP